MQTKKIRPLAITVLSFLYIAVGLLGTAAHYLQFTQQRPSASEAFWITLLGIAAVVAGIFMLFAQNWARWLALAWMGAHVAISAFHPRLRELIVHCLFLVLFAALLLRREATAYFSESHA